MTIPNYLALYNLSQIDADILIVSDLTATTSTIYTLSSTNGTITTLNSTTANISTANITSLFTNLWRGTSPTSTMIMGDTITSGNIRIGNYTTPADQTGSIYLYGNTYITGSKSLFINNGDLSLVSSTGIITGSILRGVLVGDNISLYSTTSGTLTLGSLTGGIFSINPNTTMNGNLILASGKTITLNSTGGQILCDLYTGTATGTAISLFETSSSTIGLGNLSGGIFSINPNTTMNGNLILASGKTITLNTTGGKVLCNTLTGTATSSTIEIGESGDTGLIRTRKDLYIGSTPFGSNKGIYCNYFDVLDPTNNIIFCATQTSGAISIQPSASGSLCNITIGNSSSPAGDSSSLFIYKSTSFSANKTLTMNSTGGEIKCDVYNGTTTSSNLTLGKSGDTGNLLIYKTITTNNTYSGNNTFSGANIFSGATNTFNNKILCNTLTTTATATNLVLGESGDTGLITPLRNIVMTTGSSGNKILSGYYDATSAGADLYIGNNQVGGSIILNNTYLAAGKLVNITSTGKLVNSTFESVSPTTAISLFNDITGADINISNTTNTGKINMNANVVLPANKTITLDATGGKIISNSIEGVSVSTTCSAFANLTIGDLNVGTGLTTGDVFLHNSTYTAGGNIYCNRDTYIDPSRKLVCDNHSGTSPSIDLSLAGNLTTANINVGTGLTSGNVNLGLIGMTGKISCNANVDIGTSASNKGLTCNYFQSFNNNDLMRYSATSTTGNIRLGENQSTGTITLGHTTPASDSGTLIINKTTTLAANKNLTLGSQSKLVGGSNGSVNITTISYTNVPVITTASVAGFYQVFIYGASATQTYSVCCFMSADNSGAVQTTASRNMTFQASGANWCITATIAPTSTISMGYNIVRLF